MTQTLTKRFSVTDRPVVLTNDNGREQGKRVVGHRTLLEQHHIEGLLAEEAKGYRTLPSEQRKRLLLDLSDLKNHRKETSAKSNHAKEQTAKEIPSLMSEKLTPDEMRAVCALLVWAANDKGSPVDTMETFVNDRFQTTGIERLCRNQYNDVVAFLVGFSNQPVAY